jgi:hypothetical protein
VLTVAADVLFSHALELDLIRKELNGVVTTELLAALAALVPIALVAVTVNVYVVFSVSPVISIEPEPAWLRVPVMPPGLLVAE